MNQQTTSGISPKRKRGRPKKTENEMPKRERVGRSLNRVRSQRPSRNLDSSLLDLETSYSSEQVFNIDEIKTTLRNIGENFVKWIIEGVQAVEKGTVLEASCQIQSIKSLLRENKSSREKSKSMRQRKTIDLIDPLLNSADYLTMVIDNYLQNMVEEEQESNVNDPSFTDMFQDNVGDIANYSFCEQNSMTTKSILKTQNIDTTIKRKKISFAEKATKVYQDNETSQISLKKSSQSVKRSIEGISETNNSTPENIRARQLLQPITQLEQKTELMKPSPHETFLADESPSIIESSFLKDSFSSFSENFPKNLKKFKSKTKNKKTNETSDDWANQFTTINSTLDIFQAKSKGSSANVEDIEIEKSDHHNTYDTQSNIFSDELMKIFMSQTIGNEAKETAPKRSENISLPLHDFVLTLPESSEDSLDASVRIAVSMAKESVQHSKNSSPKNSQISKAGEWTCIPENSTEIFPSTLNFEEATDGWIDSSGQGDKYCHATSNNSSLNVSLLFDETNEPSWIPGTFNLQDDLNYYKEEAKITVKQIPNEKAQDSTKQDTKCEAIISQVSEGLQNSPQDEDGRFHELRNNNEFNEYLEDNGKSSNVQKVITEVTDKSEQQSMVKEQYLKTFTILENASQTYRKTQNSSHFDVPTAETTKNIFPAANSNFSRTDTNSCRFEMSNKGMGDVKSDESKRKNILMKNPSFYPPSQSINISNNQKPVLSFSDLNQWYNKKGFEKTIGNSSNSKDLSTMSHEQKTKKQSPKRAFLREPLFHPLAQNKNMKNNQPTPKQVHSEMELKIIYNNSSDNNNIDDMLETENFIKKNLLKESLLHLPTQNNPLTRDSEQEIERKKGTLMKSEQQAQDGIKSIENRFQETLLAGHWLRSGLQQNSTSKLFPSLDLFSNAEINKQVNDNNNTNPNSGHMKRNNFDQTRLNEEIGQQSEMKVDKVEFRDAKQIRNYAQCINTDVNVNQSTLAPQASSSIQQKLMGNITLDPKQRAPRKPRNCSLLSTLTLSDTVPARYQDVDVRVDYRDPTKTHTPDWILKNMGNPDKDTSAILKDNTVTSTADISKQNKSVFTTENFFNQNNYLRNSLMTTNPLSKHYQPSIISNAFLTSDDTELVRSASKVHQSTDNQTNKFTSQQSKERRNISCAVELISQSRDCEELQSHQTCETYHALDHNAAPDQSWTKENINRGRSNAPQTGLPLSSFAPQTSAEDTLIKLKEGAATTENTICLTNNTLDLVQSRNAKIKKNELNKSGAKPKRSGQTKRLSTTKQNEPKAQNECIQLKQPAGTSISKGPQIQKTNKIKCNKASTPITTGDLDETFNEENTNNNRILDLIMNNSHPSVNPTGTPGSKVQSIIRNVPSNFSGTRDPNKVLRRSLDIANNTMERREPNSKSAKNNNAERKATDVASSAVVGCADLEQGRFNFFNQNVSLNEKDNSCDRYQSIGVEMERAKFTIDFDKNGAAQKISGKNCDAEDYVVPGKKGNNVGFIECDNMLWEESPDYINAHGNLMCRDSTKTGLKRIETQTKPGGGNPIEYVRVTQLSWEQSASCDIPPASLPVSTSRSEIRVNQQSSESPRSLMNKGASGYDQKKNVKTQAENDSGFKKPFTQNLTLDTNEQLSFSEFLQDICANSTEDILGSAALMLKNKKTHQDEILNRLESVGQPQESELIAATREELDQTFNWDFKNDETKRVKTQLMDIDSVFTQPFPRSLVLETDQQLSYTEFKQDICASSDENVLNSITLTPKRVKSEEEEIDEILNGIEFVRVPQESELFVATNIEELINNQTFIW